MGRFIEWLVSILAALQVLQNLVKYPDGGAWPDARRSILSLRTAMSFHCTSPFLRWFAVHGVGARLFAVDLHPRVRAGRLGMGNSSYSDSFPKV